MNDSLQKAAMQFPAELSKRSVELQLEALKQFREQIAQVMPEGPMLTVVNAQLDLWAKWVQLPAILMGHQEHPKS